MFSLISADPHLGKQRNEEGKKKKVSEWVFSPPFPTLFTRSLNFRPGGRGLSVPALLRQGGAGEPVVENKSPIG